MFVSVLGRAHSIAVWVGCGSACTRDRSSPQMSTQRPPSYQHLRCTPLLPLSSVKLPCLQGQFAQGFPHCLCFRGHLQGLQEGCSPGEEEGKQSTSEARELTDRSQIWNTGAGREEGRNKESHDPVSYGSLRGRSPPLGCQQPLTGYSCHHRWLFQTQSGPRPGCRPQ